MRSNGTVKLVILRALLLKKKVFKNEKAQSFEWSNHPKGKGRLKTVWLSVSDDLFLWRVHKGNVEAFASSCSEKKERFCRDSSISVTIRFFP